jgi:hypothetical protein
MRARIEAKMFAVVMAGAFTPRPAEPPCLGCLPLALLHDSDDRGSLAPLMRRDARPDPQPFLRSAIHEEPRSARGWIALPRRSHIEFQNDA